MNRLNLVTVIESNSLVLGKLVESCSVTHVIVPPADREKMGISDVLMRFSVGIENEQDILADLEQGLAM